MNWLRFDNSLSFMLAALLLAAPHPAQADYGSLLHEMEDYQPPGLMTSQLATRPEPAPAPGSAADNEFDNQVSSLQQRQAEWQQSLTESKADTAFYHPDSALTLTLQAAATDPAAAAKALATGFSLETLETLVLLRSPAIQSKESEFRAVLEGYSQVEDLDTSLRRYATLTKSLMTGVGGMSNPDAVSLKFPFPGLLALKGEIVTQEATAAREELEATRRDTLTAIRKDYAELLYARQAQQVTHSLLQLMDSINDTVSTRYQSGTTGFQEVTAIGSEREKIREDLTTFMEEQGNGEASLRAALSLPGDVGIGVPAKFELTTTELKLDALSALALEHRQEIRSQQAMIGRTERMLEMAETMLYPGLSQDLSLFDNNEVAKIDQEENPARTKESFPVTSAAANGIGLPKMPWFGTNNAYLRQTQQRIVALKKELETTKAATVLTVRMAWFRLDRAKRQKALYQDRVVPLAQANLDASQQGYAAGQSSYEKLIQSASSWLTAKLALARANSDILTAAAELDAAVGVTHPGIRGNR